MRRDLQDTFIRLVDASSQLAGRATDQVGWLRRTIVDGGLAGTLFLDPSTCRSQLIFTLPGDNESIISEKGKGEEEYVDDEKRTPLPASQSLEVNTTPMILPRGHTKKTGIYRSLNTLLVELFPTSDDF